MVFQVMGQVSDMQIGLIGCCSLNMFVKDDDNAGTAS